MRTIGAWMTSRWNLLPHSLALKVLRSTFIGTLILGIVTLIIGLGLYTWSLVQQYSAESFMLARSVASSIDNAVYEEKICERVLAIYQGLSEKVWEEERARREYAKALEGSGTEFYRETISRMVGDSESVNPLCSPANLYLSLALLSECGSGETRAQILSALGLPDQGSAAKNAQNLVLANYVDNGLIKSHFSDSLWLNSGMYYRENTLERLRDQYFASVFQGTMGDPRNWTTK